MRSLIVTQSLKAISYPAHRSSRQYQAPFLQLISLLDIKLIERFNISEGLLFIYYDEYLDLHRDRCRVYLFSIKKDVNIVMFNKTLSEVSLQKFSRNFCAKFLKPTTMK